MLGWSCHVFSGVSTHQSAARAPSSRNISGIITWGKLQKIQDTQFKKMTLMKKQRPGMLSCPILTSVSRGKLENWKMAFCFLCSKLLERFFEFVSSSQITKVNFKQKYKCKKYTKQVFRNLRGIYTKHSKHKFCNKPIRYKNKLLSIDL